MATATKEDILLRQEIVSALTTKGSSFTYKELDDNFITAYNQLVSLSQSSNVDSYSASLTYQPSDYVMYSNQMYKQISPSASTGTSPSDDTTWGKVYATDLIQAPNGVRSFSKTIANADVLTMNATPVELIPAAGAGYAIEMLSGSCSILFDEGSPIGIAYTTNKTIYIGPSSMNFAGGVRLFELVNVLGAEIKQHIPVATNTITYDPTTKYLIDNEALVATVKTGEALAGDSDIIIQGLYRLIDVS